MSGSSLSDIIFFAGECLQGHNYLILLLKDCELLFIFSGAEKTNQKLLCLQ